MQHAPSPLRKNNLYYTTCYFPTAQCSIPRKTREASKTQKESEKKKDKACLQIEIGLKGNLTFLHKLQEKSLNYTTPSPIWNTIPVASTLILHASATRHLMQLLPQFALTVVTVPPNGQSQSVFNSNTVSTPPGSKIMRITINEHVKIIELFCFIHLTLFWGEEVCNMRRNYYLRDRCYYKNLHWLS